MTDRPIPRWLVIAAVALVAIVTVYSRPYLSIAQPNALSRLYLTEVMIEDGRLDLLPAMKRHGLIYDFAWRDRPFSDKAPGSSLLAIPAYLLMRVFRPLETVDVWALMASARLIVLVPLSLFSSLFVFRRILRAIGVSEHIGLVAAIGLSVGTIVLTYSQVYFGHMLAGAFLLMSLERLVDVRALGARASPAVRRRAALWAGAAAGIAGLVEYQAIVASAALVIFGWATLDRRAAGWMIVGALPMALALGAYNWRCFGAPWSLSYQFIAFDRLRAAHAPGFVGLTWPKLDALVGVLVSRHRGLVFWSPLVLLAPWGLVVLGKRDRALAALIGGTCLYYVLFVSASSVWEAGWALGPRLLVPMFPLAAIGAAVALERAAQRPLALPPALATVFFGMALVPIASAVLPGQAATFRSPLGDFHRPLLSCGLLPMNLGHHLGLEGAATLLPLALCLVGLGAIVTWCLVRRAKDSLALVLSAALLGGSAAYFASRTKTMPPAARAEFYSFVADHHEKEHGYRRKCP